MSCREAEQWNPSRWRPGRIRRFRRHVRNCAEMELNYLIGPNGALLFVVWFDATIESAISREELHARGVKLLGDTDGNTGSAPRE